MTESLTKRQWRTLLATGGKWDGYVSRGPADRDALHSLAERGFVQLGTDKFTDDYDNWLHRNEWFLTDEGEALIDNMSEWPEWLITEDANSDPGAHDDRK